MTTLRVALIQLCSTEDIAANLCQINEIATEAVAAGAELLCLPENATWLRTHTHDRHGGHPLAGHPGVNGVATIATTLGCPILLGSALIGELEAPRASNSSFLLDAGGAVLARYDKIHLFQVDLGPGTQFDESQRVQAGHEPVIADFGGFRFGLTVCYDLRFSELYRHLARAGANVLLVPSAFTVRTGQAHWHTLLRARAIENQTYVLAPAQAGEHGGGRASFGHTIAFDPWGDVLGERSSEPGFVLVELDAARIDDVRRALPSHAHHVLG